MRWKRYQTYTSNGIGWCKWFAYQRGDLEKWQLKGKLLNEYAETEGDEPPSSLETHSSTK